MDELINTLSVNFTQIIHINDIKANPLIYWGGNGVGDRFANKRYNYSVVYINKTIKLYSENLDDTIPESILTEFFELKCQVPKNTKSICGIFIHSKRENIVNRPIKTEILNAIKKRFVFVAGQKLA